jgi:hypothetical protein
VARQWLQQQQPEGAGQASTEDADGQPAPQLGHDPCSPLPALWIWPQNHAAFKLFVGLQTQWHRDSNGQLKGLRYEAADVLLRLHKPKHPKRTFTHLQQMELAALKALHYPEDDTEEDTDD